MVIFDTTALSDSLPALREPPPRTADAIRYFASLASAHLAFVNLLINSYRRLSIYPYATEVSAWDVPVWFLLAEGFLAPIHIYQYQILNSAPSVRRPGPLGVQLHRYETTSVAEIEQIAATEGSPGEVDLFDGWSLCFRGRYADSIRSLVTAIEVLLEARLRKVLADQGRTPDAIESHLRETRMDFGARLDGYCELIGERPPGPLISWIPYLNGVRLRQEMEATRRLRHAIVHTGHRLDHSLIGPMRRAVETTTWLFDWLSLSNMGQRQLRHYTFYTSMREGLLFEFEFRHEGVVVLPPPPMTIPRLDEDEDDDATRLMIDSLDPGSGPPQIMLRMLGGGGRPADIETFARLAFARFGFTHTVRDSPPDGDSPLPMLDRFRIYRGGGSTLVFILDLDGVVNLRMIEQVAAAVGARGCSGVRFTSVLCLVNDQNGVPFELRRHDSISDDCVRFADACSIGLVKSEDLARLALGVREFGWAAEDTFDTLLCPGLNGRVPLGARRVGFVRHFYSMHRAASVELDGNVRISVGAVLVYRLRRRFHQEPIASMEQNRTAVDQAQHGKVGIVIGVTR